MSSLVVRTGQVWREVYGLERVVLVLSSEDVGPALTYTETGSRRWYHDVLFLAWPIGDYGKLRGHWSEDMSWESNQHLERVL